MKKYILITLLSLFAIATTFAQDKQYYTTDYSTGMLVGSSSDFISNYSWTGMSFSGQIFIHKNISVGGKFGFNNYYEGKAAKVHDFGDGTRVFASSYNHIKVIPFGLSFHYFPLSDNLIQPYVGFTIGAAYATESIFVQELRFSKDDYGFSITPEIGVFAKFGNTPFGARLSVSYQYTTNSYELLNQNYTDLQTLNVNLGISYMLSYKK